MSQRIEWIDAWKGLAIITVVLGHIVDQIAKYMFWFHMPLFFFISGYLYRAKYDYLDFFKKKFLYLLVPYFSFLFLFSLFQYNSYLSKFVQTQPSSTIKDILIFTIKYIYNQLYGGANLVLWFGVFWFVTCLFFTQQIYNLIYTKFGSNNRLMVIIMLSSYFLAMMNFWLLKDFIFPWSINVVLMALPFYWLGHLATNSSIININNIFLSILGTVIFTIAIFFAKMSMFSPIFNMKNAAYGMIGLNMIMALSGIFITIKLAQIISQKSYLSNAISEIGSASMLIMYLHQPIQFTIKNYYILDNQIIRVIAGLIIPYILYKIIINNLIMRKIFLGDFSEYAVAKKPDH